MGPATARATARFADRRGHGPKPSCRAVVRPAPRLCEASWATTSGRSPIGRPSAVRCPGVDGSGALLKVAAGCVHRLTERSRGNSGHSERLSRSPRPVRAMTGVRTEPSSLTGRPALHPRALGSGGASSSEATDGVPDRMCAWVTPGTASEKMRPRPSLTGASFAVADQVALDARPRRPRRSHRAVRAPRPGGPRRQCL